MRILKIYDPKCNILIYSYKNMSNMITKENMWNEERKSNGTLYDIL